MTESRLKSLRESPSRGVRDEIEISRLEYLINAVIDQIEKDLHDKDFTALEELLAFVPEDKLRGYLPEVYFDE